VEREPSEPRPGEGAIAIETEVDVEAETKEIRVLDDAAAPAPVLALSTDEAAGASVASLEIPPNAGTKEAPSPVQNVTEDSGTLRLALEMPAPPRAEAPPAAGPGAIPAVPHRPALVLPDEEAKRPAPVSAEPSPEFMAVEEEATERRPSLLRIERPPSAVEGPKPAMEAAAPQAMLRLEGETGRLDVNTAVVLEKMAQRVERITRTVEKGGVRASRSFAFGFYAFFGFVTGVIVFAAVVVGLLALAGLFHPPAAQLLRHVLDSVLGR
jgi:hypothetical protein